MNWDLMDKCEELFEKHNIRPVVGVIPNNKDTELLSYPKRENNKDKGNYCLIYDTKRLF